MSEVIKVDFVTGVEAFGIMVAALFIAMVKLVRVGSSAPALLKASWRINRPYLLPSERPIWRSNSRSKALESLPIYYMFRSYFATLAKASSLPRRLPRLIAVYSFRWGQVLHVQWSDFV